MVKTWVPCYRGVCKIFIIIAVLMKKQKLWPFVHVMLKWLFAIDFSSWILSLFVVKQGSRGSNLPINLFLTNTMVQMSTLCSNAFVSYNRFSSLFS